MVLGLNSFKLKMITMQLNNSCPIIIMELNNNSKEVLTMEVNNLKITNF